MERVLNVKNSKIVLPLDLAVYAYKNRLVKALSICMYLKFYTDGKVNEKDPLFIKLKQDLKLTDYRTFKKHINFLIENNWIGYSKESGMYFIRSLKFIRHTHKFENQQGSVMIPQDLKNFQIYLAAVLISKEIMDQEFYWDVLKKRKYQRAAYHWDAASHSRVSSPSKPRPEYFGLSNVTIGLLLDCKQTRACVIKQKAIALGYLIAKHRYKDFLVLSMPDFRLRPFVNEQIPKLTGRIRVWKVRKNNIMSIKFVEQLHDEIQYNIKFKRIEKLTI